MNRQKLCFGLAIVFGLFGLVTLGAPQALYGNGTFYDNNFGPIRLTGIAGLVLGGVFAAVGAAVRRS